MKKLITSFALFSLFGIWQVFANAENLRPSVDFSSETDLCDDISADLIIMTGSWATEVYWEFIDSEGGLVAYASDSTYSNYTEYIIPVCLNAGESYTMNAYDSFGDGWNGGTYSLVVSCESATDSFIYVGANNNGLSPSDLNSVNIGGFHLESSEEFTIVACASVVNGCIDETMFNYNPDANVDNGTCIPYIYGCLDVNALNYDTQVNTDDGSCVYDCDGEYVTISIILGSWGAEQTWELLSINGDTLLTGGPYENFQSGVIVSEQICLAIGDSLVFSAHDSYGDGWNGGSFSISSCGDIVEGGVPQISGAPEGDGQDYQFTVISCDDIIPGCMFEEAINYNVNATHPDGSCEFEIPSLLSPADGHLLEVAITDSLEYSWEPYYSEDGLATSYSIFWSSDSSALGDSIITYLYSTDTTLWTDFSTNLWDHFVEEGNAVGDSLNVYWWVCNDITYDSSIGSYTGSTDQFTQANMITLVMTTLYGCTDMTALNYNQEATSDDGSCTYPCESTTTLTLTDSYGDGWNENELVLSYTDLLGIAVDTSLTIDDGYEAMYCLDIDTNSCLSFEWVSGMFIYETSWVLTSDSDTLANGGGGSFPANGLGTCIVGCMDPDYLEYDATADIHNQDMCVDMLCDDDIVTLNLLDSYGDGWNGGFLTINDSDYTLESGDYVSFELCIDLLECTEVVYTAGSWSNENSWNITNASGSVIAEAGNMSDIVGYGCSIYGCTDSLALNYSPYAIYDDGSCFYDCEDNYTSVVILILTDTNASETSFTLSNEEELIDQVDFTSEDNLSTITNAYCIEDGLNMTIVISDTFGDGIIGAGGYHIVVCGDTIISNLDFIGSDTSETFIANCFVDFGCTDSLAINYNSLATLDDGSCEYFCPENNILTVEVGGGAFVYEVSWEISGNEGLVGTTYLCVEDGCYMFNMYDSYGDGWNGNTVVITDENGDELLNTTLETGSEASELVIVNSDCSNIGCTDSLACNYNPDVTADDGSCVYPDDYYDCLGNCINDTDADGICDELEVSGCTDPEALNYNPSATDDDTSCEYALQLSIAEIQGMTNVSPYEGQIVETSGIVTAVAPSGYFIQDSGQTWSGIYVYDNTNIPETGDEITVQAEVAEYYEMTELTEVSSFSIHSSGNIIDVIQINTGIIEAHEGCLIQAWVTCIEANNEHGEALLQEDSSNDNIVSNDFIYLYDFEVDMSYSIVGVVEYSFGEYKINPRNTLDVQQPWAVSDFNSSKTSIKMVNNFVEIESSIRGEQGFVIYNIVGDVVMNGVFDGSISIPMHRFETATYLIRVEDSNGLSTTHKLINQ